MSLFSLPSAITVKRRDSHQRTDLFAIERSQLGQERHDHCGRDIPNSGYTLQKLVVLVSRGILLRESLKLSVQFRNLLRHVLDQRLDGRPDRGSGQVLACTLGSVIFHELPSPNHHGLELPLRRIGNGPHGRTVGLRKHREDLADSIAICRCAV